MNIGKSERASWIRSMALVCAVGLLAACGNPSPTGNSTNTASDIGITPTTITVGSTQPLTGPAAPGYSEIAPASNAYFDYVNAHGGILGRRIINIYRDDGYNPANTATLTRQLVLQDNVFATFGALGTPTQLAVVGYLNLAKVPQLFISSGCDCWNDVANAPYTFGWQPDYTIEGKILGQYIEQKYAGKKVGYFYQNDEFGLDGVKGLDQKVPAGDVVSRQSYVTSGTNLTAQVSALQAAGADVVASYSIPAFTTLAILKAATIGYHPIWVVSSVGSDPTTLGGLLKRFSKGLAGLPLIAGMVTDTYLPAVSDTSNPWISLFKGIHDSSPAIKGLPWDGNVLYGLAQAYTFVQAVKAAGRNPTRASFVRTLEASGALSGGPALAPYLYSSSSHLGIAGVQVGTIGADGTVTLSGPVYTSTDSGPITQYSGTPATPPTSGIP